MIIILSRYHVNFDCKVFQTDKTANKQIITTCTTWGLNDDLKADPPTHFNCGTGGFRLPVVHCPS